MSDSVEISMTVNGERVSARTSRGSLLSEFLRESLSLTGVHVGCDTSQCGSCVVRIDGKTVKSCAALAEQCAGSEIVTVEGLSEGDELHPMQKAFHEHHGLQCGFCTPGMIMTGIEIVERHRGGSLSESDVRRELEGNLCRCTGYHNIVKAIMSASREMGAS